MRKFRKTVCIILTFSILLGSFGFGAFAAEPDGTAFTGVTVLPSKTEYSAGEEITVSLRFRNSTDNIVGYFVTYIEYEGDVCLAPGVTEADFSSLMPEITCGADFRLSDPLSEKTEALATIAGAFTKAYIAVSRAVVIIRQFFASVSASFSNIFNLRRKENLGSCSVVYDGKEVVLSVGISYIFTGKTVTGSSDLTFPPVTADEMTVSDEEKALCKNWFNTNIVNAGTKNALPAYNFSVGTTTLRDSIDDWSFAVTERDVPCSDFGEGLRSVITFTNEKLGLEGRTEAVLYEDSATCEWTVYLKNTSEKNSGKITDFRAVDTTLNVGKNELYASRGSASAAEDFTLFRVDGTGEHTFNCRNGRSSECFLPYFNICGESFGACFAIGWSGQWKADIGQTATGVTLSAKQETLNAKLVPEEEIRSPLASLTFYKNTNPVKGFNMFRSHVLASLFGRGVPETITNVDPLYVSPERSAEVMINDLNRIPAERFENLDNLWMDAGWYCCGTGSIWDDRFGVWKSTENRFPEGIAQMSNYASERDMGLILWYEEERLSNVEESELYTEAKKNDGWLLGADSSGFTTGLVWNFGNENALQYIRKFIGDTLKENGVTGYREDSNFDPLSYWNYGDRNIYGGRSGICENHYVDGHYRFLDYLFGDNENLKFFDCCASGGRRLDYEIIRRGVPLWRSDYNCEQHPDLVEATQSQTYALSFWIPYTGTSCYTGNEYRVRSSIYQDFQLGIDQVVDTPSYEMWLKYAPERAMLNKNFYPISFGGTDFGKITAMQYGDADRGFAVIYKRSQVSAESFSFCLSGLNADARYTVYDYDSPESTAVYSGAELMDNALNVNFGQGEQALIIEYEVN